MPPRPLPSSGLPPSAEGVLSVRAATCTSQAAMAERKPEPRSPRKKIRPKSRPNGMAAKTRGTARD